MRDRYGVDADARPARTHTKTVPLTHNRAPMARGLAAAARLHEAPKKTRHGEGILTSTKALPESLPDPEPLLRNLARSVFEALAGVREVEQVARWVAPEVFSSLLRRVQHANRARQLHGAPVRRPNIVTKSCLWQSPREGIVEAALTVDLGMRVRAVVIRLEVYRGRWRAEILKVL